jgi:hypothetical protein
MNPEFLRLEAKAAKTLVEMIQSDGDVDEDVIASVIESETNLKEVVGIVAREIRETEAMAGALGEMIAEMKERRDRLDRKAEKLRGLVSNAMGYANVPRFDYPDMGLSNRSGQPKVVIDDVVSTPESLAHTQWVRTKTTYSWDLKKIKEGLEMGVDLPFATLSQPTKSLTIRTK